MSIERRELDDLIRMSRAVGGDRLLVQGGGGNTSVKSVDGARMGIKASGVPLSEVGETTGWVEVKVAPLIEMIDDDELAGRPRREAHDESVRRVQASALSSSGRPSLETGFHALFGRLVLHTHPVYVNTFGCLEDGRALLEETLGAPVVWVTYQTPGFALSRAVAAARRGGCGDADVVVLENHGLIVGGDSVSDILARTATLVDAGRRVFGPLHADLALPASPEPSVVAWADRLGAALGDRGASLVVRPARLRAVAEAARWSPERSWLGALVPDDVVYGVHEIDRVAEGVDAGDWLDERGWPPPRRLLVVLQGRGVVLAGPSAGAIDAMEQELLAHALIRRLAADRGTLRMLAGDERRYLSTMESETYRQEVAAASNDTSGPCRS